MPVQHVSVEFEQLAVAEARVEDVGSILAAVLFVHFFFIDPLIQFLHPRLFPLQTQIQRIGVFAGIPAGAVGAVFFDQVGALAEPCAIFTVVTAGLGGVIVQMAEHFVAYLLLVPDFVVF